MKKVKPGPKSPAPAKKPTKAKAEGISDEIRKPSKLKPEKKPKNWKKNLLDDDDDLFMNNELDAESEFKDEDFNESDGYSRDDDDY